MDSLRNVDEELRDLLIEFGPTRKRHHPEYPFWRLQNDGIWTVPHDEELTRRAPNTDPLKSELLDYNIKGGFTASVWTTLKEHQALRYDLVRLILDEHFQPSFHADICNAVGLSLAIPTDERTRDPDFRKNVLQAYSHQCAICGFDLTLGNTSLGLEAAHIQWHNHGGPDEVTNGVALCALHHKMFDKGALHITTEPSLLVSEDVHGSDPHLTRLRKRHGDQIQPQQRETYLPAIEDVDWHRKEVFREPARA